MADSAPPSPLYPPAPADAAYTIRHLSSADIPAVRQLHRTLVPHPLPPAFFHQLLMHPTRLCLVAVPTPTPTSSADPAPAPTPAPVAFISAALHTPTNDLALSKPQPHSPTHPQSLSKPQTAPAPAPAPALEAHILTLGVAPTHRRHRLATRLVRAAVRALRAQAALSALVPHAHAYAAGGSYFALGSGEGSGEDEDEDGDGEEGEDSAERAAKAGMLVTAHLAASDAASDAEGEGVDADADGDAGARAFWARLGLVERRDAKVGVAPRVGGLRAGVRVEGRVRA